MEDKFINQKVAQGKHHPYLVFVENDAICKTSATICYTEDDVKWARRIAACINACVGIPTEQLEGTTLKEYLEAKDCPEPDYDNMAKDFDEDARWDGAPTEHEL